MIKRAPSLASSDSASRGFSPTPTANSASIRASISADGGTVRLTAQVLLRCLAGLEGTYAVALTAPGLFTAVLRRDPGRCCAAALVERIGRPVGSRDSASCPA